MLRRVLMGVVRFYQVAFSSWMPPTCRYTPSCSAYALLALQHHGGVKGGWLAVRRVLRCHPWGGYGYDPVPGTTAGTPDELEKTATGGHGGRPASSDL